MKYTVPRGTKDITPNEIAYWQYVEKTAQEIFTLYNYSEIRTPIFESTDLKKWDQKEFIIDNQEAKPKDSFIARKSKIVKAYVNSASNRSFYKIMVE